MGRANRWKSPLATPVNSMLTLPLSALTRPLTPLPKEKTLFRQNGLSLSLTLKVRPLRLTVQTRTGFSKAPARRLWIPAPLLSIRVRVQKRLQLQSPAQAERRPSTPAYRGLTLLLTLLRTEPG